MSVISISTRWAQRPVQTPMKSAARMNWNDELASFVSSTRLAASQPKTPQVKDVVVAGPCTEVPFWWGNGGGRA